MPENSRLRSAVGFAMKAGRLQSGDFSVERLVRAKKALLVLIDEGASANTREKYERLCSGAHIIMTSVPELGTCIGKPGRMLAAVTDQNFAYMIQNAATADGENHTRNRG